MKLIATDLDGTLLNSKHQVSSENENALRQAQRDGIEVVVSTGRAYFDVVSIFEPLGIKTWVISANGAVIHDPDGRLYHSETIDKKRAYDILSWLESENYYYEVFTDSAIYTPQNGRQLLDVELDRVKSANPEADLSVLMQAAEVQYSQSGFAYIDTFQELFEEDKQIDFYNILGFSFFKEKLESGWQRYQEDKDLTLVSSADHNFELSSKKASKGQALERLAKRLNIPMKETAAVGDSLNDRSMLEAAGKGVAMGNAREDIKAIADAVTLTNDEHGVAHMIRHLL
ncbi:MULTISPECIES: Cof-type HAD-IIB family hydrolase [Bacillus]|uniref:Cof-type HAD-IIB family hydrolase n=1 Tax=Bacillus TaxID=1386 RepID=UPI000D04046F|nr:MULTISPECIES: Cof-type HAD-IIB family hydrolase [Bacillus]MBV7319006.1 Cof-type HAD-IIB family hydrolase [Halalkalibacterium halodurans]MCV0024043.1 Cof-type HAD-IIB family hydrolase [Bacillus sp. XT-2]PRS06975.1 Cof-type HAD-IIB family hydrolase [Bacillus halotolerans]QDK67070.1 HAD family phosphatase [Bacillus halotolerans]QKS06267.1 HAD family phosphatase [Bacillus halotolerans]